MDQKSSRPEGQSFGTGQYKDPKANSVSDSLNRGKDAVMAAATDSAASSGADAIWIKSFGCAAQFADEQKLPGFTRP